MADISDVQSTDIVRLVGSSSDGTEQTPVGSTSNGELLTYDVANSTGVDSLIAVPGTTVVELKVGASALTSRRYIQIQATDRGIKWGFSLTTQSFDLFKDQLIILPYGPDVTLYVYNTTSSSVDVAVGEIS